jgi:hypothetical protein
MEEEEEEKRTISVEQYHLSEMFHMPRIAHGRTVTVELKFLSTQGMPRRCNGNRV